jgi:hypothetical protein
VNKSSRKFINKPYHYSNSRNLWLIRSGLFGLFVFLFLYLFTPFGLHEREGDLFALALGFGLITTLSMGILNVAIPALFSRAFSEEKWTVGKEILWTMFNIGVIGVCNTYYFAHMGGFFSLGTVLLFTGFAMAVGIFPVTISVLIKEALSSRRYREGSMSINAEISRTAKSALNKGAPLPIRLPSQNSNEDIYVDGMRLFYIKASDNYVEVYYAEEDSIKKAILRNSLKEMERALEMQPYFLRCHKSYIVNLRKVTQVTGNAQGYRLIIHELDAEIPVSRQLNNDIKSLLLSAQ